MKKYLILLFLFLGSISMGIGVFLWQHNTESAQELLITPIQKNPIATAFSLEQAPMNALKGTVMGRAGDVYWESRVATEPALLQGNIHIQQGERIIASESGSVTITFPPAGSIEMYPLSVVDIIQTLPVNVVFMQRKGSIHYTVFGSSPISVRSYYLLVTSESGKFNVTVPENDMHVVVEVLDGQVRAAFNSLDFITQTITVYSGQTLYYSDITRTAEIL